MGAFIKIFLFAYLCYRTKKVTLLINLLESIKNQKFILYFLVFDKNKLIIFITYLYTQKIKQVSCLLFSQ